MSFFTDDKVCLLALREKNTETRCLMEQIAIDPELAKNKIDNRITTLSKELDSCFSLNRKSKEDKIEGLRFLKQLIHDGNSLPEAVRLVKEKFPQISSGYTSQRTSNLLTFIEKGTYWRLVA